MTGENRQLVTNEPVEFETQPVEVEDCRKITYHFRGIYEIYPNLMKENRWMSTWNRLDLQTLGSQPVMPKNLPDHWRCDEHGITVGVHFLSEEYYPLIDPMSPIFQLPQTQMKAS